MNLIMEQHIILDMEGSTQEETLHALAEITFRERKMSDTDTFPQELYKREQGCTTGFGKEITIPHAHHTCVKEAGVLFVRVKHKIEWKSIDEKPVETVVYLFALDNKHDSHLKALSELARKLMHEDLVDVLKTAEKQQILSEIIDTIS